MMEAMNELKMFPSFKQLNECVVKCRLCPRLVKYREEAPAKKSLQNEKHWRKPVPGFGDHEAWLLILGLAPSLIGGNRTGRIFTGDESARFLFNALYKEGFANQSTSESRDDGLKLKGCYITASVKCVPPQHKPMKQEFINCSRYYLNEIALLKNLKCVLALGKLAFDAYLGFMKEQGLSIHGIKFRHGIKVEFEGFPTLYASYHPSPQNTNTGIMTEAMFRQLLKKTRTASCRV
jgi:uracil-DNA glycosylase family 4